MEGPMVLYRFAIGRGVGHADLLRSMQKIIDGALVDREPAFFQGVPQAAMDFKQQGVRLANCFACMLGQQRGRREKNVKLPGY